MTEKIISRKEAREAGFTRYFTGKPCIYGHIAERRVSCSICVVCARFKAHKALFEHRTNKTDRGLRIIERDRLRRLERAYGLSERQYNEMLLVQNYRCAICGNEETTHTAGVKRRLSVDHDHTTGAIRALLCGKCNRKLGEFECRRDKFERYLSRYDTRVGQYNDNTTNVKSPSPWFEFAF